VEPERPVKSPDPAVTPFGPITTAAARADADRGADAARRGRIRNEGGWGGRKGEGVVGIGFPYPHADHFQFFRGNATLYTPFVRFSLAWIVAGAVTLSAHAAPAGN
jgi:hypothetical protein